MSKLFSVVLSFVFLASFGNSANAAIQRTFAMIKPSGISKTNEIKSIINSYGLKIQKSKKITLTEKQFNKLYFMHKEKPFFPELKATLVDKEVEVMILQGEDAVSKYRLAVNDIRAKYALNKTENAVHGSDTWKRAHEEICIFFDCGVKKTAKKAEPIKTEQNNQDARDQVVAEVNN